MYERVFTSSDKGRAEVHKGQHGEQVPGDTPTCHGEAHALRAHILVFHLLSAGASVWGAPQAVGQVLRGRWQAEGRGQEL